MNLDPLSSEFGRQEEVLSQPMPAPASLSFDRPRWNPLLLILFRFLFIYWIVYILPFPVHDIPQVGHQWAKYYEDTRDEVITWTAKTVFDKTITIKTNGSGDTTFNYIQIFCYAVVALAGSLLWSLIDFRRRHYTMLHDLLRIYGRFWLASVLLSYGVMKIIKAQFPDPPLDRLLQPVGDTSPMGLAWTFMGFSVGYNLFTGLGELMGALLLTTRRTTLLGALVSFGVMINIVMINFCYDVPVKIFSSHLVLMCLFLAAPDLVYLLRSLVFNLPVGKRHLGLGFDRWWYVYWPVVLLRTALVAYYCYVAVQGAIKSQEYFHKARTMNPFFGIWSVEEFTTDGKMRPPLYSDTTRWRRVVFDYPNSMNVLVGDRRERYQLKVDYQLQTMTLTDFLKPGFKLELQFTRSGYDELQFEGVLDNKPFQAKLKKEEVPEFRLTSRGFNWINEYPFNR